MRRGLWAVLLLVCVGAFRFVRGAAMADDAEQPPLPHLDDEFAVECVKLSDNACYAMSSDDIPVRPMCVAAEQAIRARLDEMFGTCRYSFGRGNPVGQRDVILDWSFSVFYDPEGRCLDQYALNIHKVASVHYVIKWGIEGLGTPIHPNFAIRRDTFYNLMPCVKRTHRDLHQLSQSGLNRLTRIFTDEIAKCPVDETHPFFRHANTARLN